MSYRLYKTIVVKDEIEVVKIATKIDDIKSFIWDDINPQRDENGSLLDFTYEVRIETIDVEEVI